MIKKFVFFISLIAIILVSCNDYIKSEVIMYYTDSVPKLEHFYKYYGNMEYVAKEVRYAPNGSILSEGYYNENGEKHGTWINYFENGKKSLEETYVNGVKEGQVTEWYKDGTKMYTVDYAQNLPDGKWIIWDETGKKISTTTYKNGQLVEK
ncbi:MAG: hypothetical protein JXL97_06750 [Bacteroidales bacterium]|nr:hypothetical protein [Bacteroidales bacterium]